MSKHSAQPGPDEILEKATNDGQNPKTGEDNYGLYWSGNSLKSTFVALTLAYGAKGAEGSLKDIKNIKWHLNSPEMVKVLEWLKEAAQLPPAGFVNAQELKISDWRRTISPLPLIPPAALR